MKSEFMTTLQSEIRKKSSVAKTILTCKLMIKMLRHSEALHLKAATAQKSYASVNSDALHVSGRRFIDGCDKLMTVSEYSIFDVYYIHFQLSRCTFCIECESTSFSQSLKQRLYRAELESSLSKTTKQLTHLNLCVFKTASQK